MTMLNEYEDDLLRARTAREQWIQLRCLDLPAIYAAQIPCSFDADYLLKAEACIRATMLADHARITRELASPWIKQGGKCPLVDFAKLDAKERAKLYTPGLRMLGMPAMVKNGKGPDGVLYMFHPEVKAAIANSPRTAEHAAQVRFKEIEKQKCEATTNYVDATNADVDREADGTFCKNGKALDNAAIASLKARVDELQVLWDEAKSECTRLANDWEAAAQIVLDEDGDLIVTPTATGPKLAE